MFRFNILSIGRRVRNPKRVRQLAALRAVVGLLLFFLLLRPGWLPKWVYWVLLVVAGALGLAEVASDFRRMRPRRRWRDAGLFLLTLSVVLIAVMPWVILSEASDEKGIAYALLGLGGLTLAGCIACLWHWRRLRAEAELRIWQLRTERRRRSVARARTEAEMRVL